MENKIILSLKGHDKNITMVRYFINDKDKNEYLISADFDYRIIVWDISNNYNIKYNFLSSYNGNIYSCLLVFPSNIPNNYLIISTRAIVYKDHDDQYTKLYNLESGSLIKNFNNTNNIRIFYLISWYNKINKEYYIIQLGAEIILINSLSSDDCFSLESEDKNTYYSGFVYEKNDIDYLCSSSIFGSINIWDLSKKNLFKVISSFEDELWHIIQWNDKYSIVADRMNKSFKIIDMENYKIISNFSGEHKETVLCVKKIYHPIYGESLLSFAEDKTIKLWTT